MKIAIGSDHPAYDTKQEVIKYLKSLGHEVIDCGTYNKIRTHYPIYGREVALNVVLKKADLGVAICGTGVGISNSCNKVKGARCVLVHNTLTAKIAKEKYNANIISFGARVVGVGAGCQIVEKFLASHYKKNNGKQLSLIDNKIKHLNSDKNLFTNIIKNWEKGKYTNGTKQEDIPLPKDIKC